MTEARSLRSGDKLSLDKINCLIIDDNMQSLDILGTVCAGFGMRNTTKCQSPIEAQGLLQRSVFDFILTDVQMPEFNGFDLVKWIRREASEANRFVPIIIVTGHTRTSQIMRARDCGAHFIITKPVTPKVLLDRITWVARDERSFIECETYCGPDRRFKREGPPAGMAGRRSDDLPAEVGDAVGGNLSQDEINAMMKPAKVSL